MKLLNKLITLLFISFLSITSASAAWDDLPTDKVFSPTSFWYTPIPADAPVHPNSANFVSEFLKEKSKYLGTVAINTTEYTSPVYIARDDYALINIKHKDCGRNPGITNITSLEKQWTGVAMPPVALPSKGTDAEVSLYDPINNKLVEVWKAEKDLITGQWYGCWGGGFTDVNTSSGIFGKWGTTATGLPFIGGQITPEELIRGEIRHVIGIALPNPEHFTIRSWPALRSDGWNPTTSTNWKPNRIPEGLRFRLDPTFNVDGSDLNPTAKIIAKAAQKYGFIVWDRAGNISLRAQNASTQTQMGMPNLYPLIFKGMPTYEILKNFPWDKIQFLPMDYGKPL